MTIGRRTQSSDKTPVLGGTAHPDKGNSADIVDGPFHSFRSQYLGIGVASLINILDPEIGGGLSKRMNFEAQ